MLHPDFELWLANAHIDDLHRAAARRRAIRLALRVARDRSAAAASIATLRSASA